MPTSNGRPLRAFPDIYVILFGIIVLLAASTWVIPAGAYERSVLDNGREVVVAGSYHGIEQTPVGVMDVVTAIPKGLSEASSVVFLTLLVGGSVGVLRRAGVIDIGIERLVAATKSRAELVIPVLMGVFAAVAAFIGTPELSIAYLPIVLPLMIRLGYDSVVATAVALLSTSLGFAFGISSPSTIGVGHLVAELPMYSGAGFRGVSFVAVQLAAILFVMRYARRVKASPELALNREEDTALRTRLAQEVSSRKSFNASQQRAAVLTLVLFVGIVAAVLIAGLGLDELSGLFVAMAVIVSLVAGDRANKICSNFNESLKEMLVGALIVGVARGASVVMAEGNILDTLVFHLAAAVGSLPSELTAVGILVTQSLFNFLVPSGSGQCLLTLPVLVPLGDLVGLTRQVVVLATHWGDGITNVVFPTSGYFMATLAISHVSLKTWLEFYLPLFWAVLFLAVSGLVIAQAIALGPF